MAPWSVKSKNVGLMDTAQRSTKNTILTAVTEAVSEVQYQYRNSVEAIPSNDITARLCTAIEAVFIHGLKETFLGRLSSRFGEGGSGTPRMPEPSFWTFALVFSHKEVISQIESFSQINTDVGRSRTWLRAALNDGLLVSYLTTMMADKVSLAVHYEKFAFLRDPEKRDLCLSFLTGISVFAFSLSLNVSTLNKWQTRPLVMAGCWKDSKLEIDIGDDVAAEIVEQAEAVNPPSVFARTLAEPIRDTGTGLYMGRGLLNEDEALRIILQSTPVAFSPQTQSFMGLNEDTSTAGNIDSEDEKVDTCDVSNETYPPPQGQDTGYESKNENEDQDVVEVASKTPSPEMMLPRSLTVSPTLEWDTGAEPGPEVTLSPCLAQEMEELLDEVEATGRCPSLSPAPSTPSPGPQAEAGGLSPASPRCLSPLSDCSSLSLGRSPPDQPPAPRLTIALRDTIHSPSGGGDLITEQNIRQRRLDGLGFGSPPNVRVASLSLAQNLSLTRCLDLICHEAGLDSQDWRCHDCSKSIGALFGPPRVCQFTRKYYCEDCHNNTDMATIPARIMYNWDLGQYRVAKSSHLFLRSVSTKPMINISTFSPNLSRIAPVLDQAHRLRKQLIYLSAYLTACPRAAQEGIKVTLAEIVWPRDYLYTGTEVYSIEDLEQLHSGQLIATLVSAVKLCTRHVSSCLVCSGRGFICEICRDRKPVYPFNLDTTSQCKDCNTVFHLHCSKGIVSCPKCERIENRNLQWHVNNSKMTREIGPVDE